MRLIGLISLALAILSPIESLRAQVETEGFWSLQLENDLWGSNDDRFYTSGIEFSYVSAKRPPYWLNQITDYLPFYNKGDSGFFGANIGQQIFTPEDIEIESLQADDRPYAGWLYLDAFIGHRYENFGKRESINGFILTLGVVGPASFAEESQRRVHQIVDAPDPKGWDNQLENEIGINGTWLKKWRRIEDLGGNRQFETGLHTGVTLGTVYRSASVGLMTRWGSYLKDDIGPPTIRPGFPGLPAFNPNRHINWYLFAGAEIRAVAHNIFLDGNTFEDSHSVEREDWVGDIQLGAAFVFRHSRISFSNMIRSREFEGQSEGTRYGAINFTLFID